jgi:DNA repair exonuclease SbcCD ATPase subunit
LIDDDRVIESLIKSMENDRNQLVRSYAARALGNISKVLDKKKKEETLILPLIKCLNEDPFYGARAEAAEALGTICEKSESEICIYVTKTLVASKIEEEKRKRKEPRSGRVQKEVDAAFEKFPQVMNRLRELQVDLTKLEQDIKETNEKADRIVLAKGKTRDEELQSLIEEFNNSKNNNDVTARAITKKFVDMVSDFEEDVVPMFMLTVKRR